MNDLNCIQLYEHKYIDQETFFNLITGCGEQTEFEEGFDRLSYYLRLLADTEKTNNEKQCDYFISQYPFKGRFPLEHNHYDLF